MKSIYGGLIVMALLVLQSSACKKTSQGDQQKLQEAIDNTRLDLEKSLGNDVPSLSVLIETPNGSYFTTSVGKNGKTITENTNFRFASNTKNFTATAILNMMQDGWLNIDDKITAIMPGSNIPYVPDMADWNFPHKNEITIKELLQHNAGVYDLTNDATQLSFNGDTYADHILETTVNHQFTTTEYISVLTANNLTYGPPNTVYHYSNTGYSILGEIISRIYTFHVGADKTYADYMYDKITGPKAKVPLDIHFVQLATDQQLPEPYVTGMIRLPDSLSITDRENASGHVAEGNGIGTMHDLNKYIRTLMKGKNVLTQQSVALMQTAKGLAPPPAGGNHDYALGCFHMPGLGYGHNGATEGYLSLMLYDPETDVSVIVMLPYWDFTNMASTENSSFAQCLDALQKAGMAAKTALGY